MISVPLALMRSLIRRRYSKAIYVAVPCGSRDGQYIARLISTKD